jgi:hypothetical protein
MEFSSDTRMKEIEGLAREFFDNVIKDEKPVFVSDEATIWDVSMAAAEELLKACSDYYRVPVSMDDLKLPLWELIPSLNERRKRAAEYRVPNAGS